MNVPSRSQIKNENAMKHTYSISVLTAAAALSLLVSASSCIKVTPDSGDQAEHYIGFTSSVGTKAPVESAADMNEFAVWAAYYAEEILDSEPMMGVRVYRDSNLWRYDELKLWEEGDWHFEAFYPLPSTLAATEVVQPDEDALKVRFFAPKTEEQSGIEGLSIEYYYGPTASHDLMTAERTRTYSSASPDASPVQFEFKHLLSRVSIAVKTATDDVTLKSLTFGGMSVLGAYNTFGYSGRWQLLTELDELSDVQPGSFSDLNANIPSPLHSDGTSVDVLSDLLLIPQTPGDGTNGHAPITLEVTYAISDAAPETKTIALPSSTPWEPGHHYRYTLKLAMADVTLSVDMVPWDERDYTVIF